MMMGKFPAFITIITIMVIAVASISSESSEGKYLIKKRDIRIVITDSGLGGLSVMEDIALKISNSSYYNRAELIFVNALFDSESGYNSLTTRDEKVAIFNRVLAGIEHHYSPDAIVVACNTLSVLIDENEYISSLKTPVIGIIEPGVELILNKLEEDNSAAVIIFGTETTIEEGSHLRALSKTKVSVERVVTQACPHLQSYIEQDPDGEETELLIGYYLQEALSGIPEGISDIFLSLNCSHYGYSEKLWKEAVHHSGFNLAGIINPNSAMSSLILVKKNGKMKARPEVTLKVVSKVEIRNVIPVAGIFAETLPLLSEALQNYVLVSDLF
jgi:glutamate racemase